MAAALAPRDHPYLWIARPRPPLPATLRLPWIARAWYTWLLALSARPEDSEGEARRDPPNLGSAESANGEPISAEDQAFVALATRYQAPLLDYLYGMTRDRELAADLVQETLLKAYASGEDCAQITHPQAWLYRIATNSALNALRRRRRFLWIPLSHLDPELLANSADPPALPALATLPPPSSDDIAATVAERELIWQVLAELPARWRAVLLLQTTAGFSVAEIAQLLSLTPANTRKILFRAKERFRELHTRLDAEDGPDEPDAPSQQGGPDQPAKGGR